MLNFDEFGFLIPNKPIQSTIDELEKVFVVEYSSVERSKLFQEYLKYLKDLKHICGIIPLTQWVNGSFVSKSNPRPKDIDVVTFIDKNIINTLGEKIRPFTFPYSKINYSGVDAYIVESYSGSNTLFQHDLAYWRSQFDSTRRNRNTGLKTPKGFLEIIL